MKLNDHSSTLSIVSRHFWSCDVTIRRDTRVAGRFGIIAIFFLVRTDEAGEWKRKSLKSTVLSSTQFLVLLNVFTKYLLHYVDLRAGLRVKITLKCQTGGDFKQSSWYQTEKGFTCLNWKKGKLSGRKLLSKLAFLFSLINHPFTKQCQRIVIKLEPLSGLDNTFLISGPTRHCFERDVLDKTN